MQQRLCSHTNSARMWMFGASAQHCAINIFCWCGSLTLSLSSSSLARARCVARECHWTWHSVFGQCECDAFGCIAVDSAAYGIATSRPCNIYRRIAASKQHRKLVFGLNKMRVCIYATMQKSKQRRGNEKRQKNTASAIRYYLSAIITLLSSALWSPFFFLSRRFGQNVWTATVSPSYPLIFLLCSTAQRINLARSRFALSNKFNFLRNSDFFLKWI